MTERDDASTWAGIQKMIVDAVDTSIAPHMSMIVDYIKTNLNPLIERIERIEQVQSDCPARKAAESAKDEIKQVLIGLWTVTKYGILLYLGSKLLRPEVMEGLKNVISQ